MKYGAIYPDLKGRTVIVTGGASGIGEAIVDHFARQGAKVGFLDIAEKEGKALAARLKRKKQKAHFEPCDLTDIDALKRAIANVRKVFGPVTVLINNAAHDERHTLEQVTPEYFDDRIRVNLRHQFFAIQAVVPDMKKAGGGAIVNLTSTSWMLARANIPIYVAAKAACYGLVRGLARDLGRDNIRINALAPGWIMTERQKRLWVKPGSIERLMEDQAIQHTLSPDDIARAILFYASEDSNAATNQLVVFDGGWV